MRLRFSTKNDGDVIIDTRERTVHFVDDNSSGVIADNLEFGDGKFKLECTNGKYKLWELTEPHKNIDHEAFIHKLRIALREHDVDVDGLLDMKFDEVVNILAPLGMRVTK